MSEKKNGGGRDDRGARQMKISSEMIPIEQCKKCWQLNDSISGKRGVFICFHTRKLITRYWNPTTGEYLK